MFIQALTILSVYTLAASATTTLLTPAPGDVFTTGKKCSLKWAADTTGVAGWKTASVQLMSGDNFDMVHITTLTEIDGTVDGEYTYDCPEVKPNSDIYFYQISGPATEKSWTGRFTIAAADGTVTPPATALQPDNKAIPWGIGALADPSKAVAAPAYLGDDAAAPVVSGSGSASSGASASTTSGVVSASKTVPTTTAKAPVMLGASSSAVSGAKAAASSTVAIENGALANAPGVFGLLAVAFALLL